MGNSYEAGIDLRDVWRREANAVKSPAFVDIEHRINNGHALADAVRERKGFFPQLFCEMVELGEQTGKLGQTFLKLAEHYEHLVRLRRTFLMVILWPCIQLFLGVVIIGALIWLMDALAGLDLLGLGLSGAASSGVFFLGVGAIIGGIALSIYAVLKGWLGSWPLALAYRLPMVGTGLQMVSLSRMAWSMSMANDAGMDPHRMMKLAVNAGGPVYYGAHLPQIEEDLTRGRHIHQALARAGDYPRDFLDAVESGEQTGMLAESMSHLAERYKEQSQARNGTVAFLLGVIVWIMIGILLITAIIRLFQIVYLGAIYEAMEPI